MQSGGFVRHQSASAAALTALNMAAFANHQKKLMAMEQQPLHDKESTEESPDEEDEEEERCAAEKINLSKDIIRNDELSSTAIPNI